MLNKSILVWTIVAAALAGACTTASIGSVKSSPDVARQFENLQVNPNYRYWYLNQENNPYGVIGLDREYKFDGGPLWRAVEPDSPTFKKVVGLVQSFPAPGSYTTGSSILDHQGRLVGVWYSSLTAGVTVDPVNQVVSLATRSAWRTP